MKGSASRMGDGEEEEGRTGDGGKKLESEVKRGVVEKWGLLIGYQSRRWF